MFSMKPWVRAMALGAALMGSAATAALAEPVELKLADRLPAEHYIVKQGLAPWIAAVSAGGAVEVKEYHGQQLGKGSESLNMLKSGIAQMVEMSPGLIGQEMQLSSVTELPLAATACQGARAYAALNQPGTVLDQAEATPNGATLVISMTVAPYYIFSSKELAGAADLEGLKVATQGPTLDRVITALGGTPIRVAASEIYDAITRGTVDAVVFPALSIGSYDVGGHIKTVLAGQSFGQSALGYFIDRATFEALPAETQAQMLAEGEKAAEQLCGYMAEQEAAALDKLVSQGATLLQLSDADVALMREKLAPIAQQWAAEMDAKGQPGSQVLADYQAALEAAAAQ